MPVDLEEPDLVTSIHADPFAPRAARHCVGQVDAPSPDLRNAVALLTSELVTGAVEQDAGEHIKLRVWMPQDVVRVEMSVASDYLLDSDCATPHPYGSMLLDRVADRWSVVPAQGGASVWFEIDRHRARAETEAEVR
jgi:hypothetical protein